MGNETISWTKIGWNLIFEIIIICSVSWVLKFVEGLEESSINWSFNFKRQIVTKQSNFKIKKQSQVTITKNKKDLWIT